MSGALGSALNVVSSVLQQSFSTLPQPNLQFATYSLSIRYPGIAAAPYLTYSFPLSPQSIRTESAVMSSVYDVAGPPSTNGVTRIVDQYGIAPPVISIEGTTGWDRHSMDYFQYTGLQSIQQLDKVIRTYIKLNQTVIAVGGSSQMYTLEFWDDFTGSYWQVEPIGEFGLKQSAQQPLLTYYSFRLAVVKKLSEPIDAYLRSILSQVAALAMNATLSAIGPVISQY